MYFPLPWLQQRAPADVLNMQKMKLHLVISTIMAKYFILVSGEIQFPFEIHEKIVKLHRHENGCHGNSKSLDISRTV